MLTRLVPALPDGGGQRALLGGKQLICDSQKLTAWLEAGERERTVFAGCIPEANGKD